MTYTSYEVLWSKTWNLEQSCLIYCHHYLEKQNPNFSPQAALKLVLSALCYVFGGFLRISLSTMGRAGGPGEIMDYSFDMSNV